MFEEPFFAFDPSSISDEFSIRTDDSVTGDDDDDRIFVIGSTDSAYSFGISGKQCLFFVASSFSIRDFFEGFPCFFLEIRSFGGKWDRESFSFSYKILEELFFYFRENGVFLIIMRRNIDYICKAKFDQVGIASFC
jgi:hypothetical protein